MARVYKGSDFQEVYDARNIYNSNIEGDNYAVRRSANDQNLDPRSSSFWQKDVVDKMGLSARIWKNKKECWKDHFKRSKKTFSYGDRWDTPVEKVLSGYQLAINLLMGSLDFRNSSYYDPKCFCITPCDIFGEPLNLNSRLLIDYADKLDYFYDETKLTFQPGPGGVPVIEKFCSSITEGGLVYNYSDLRSQYCITRSNNAGSGHRGFDSINKIVQWFDIVFSSVDNIFEGTFGIWDNTKFIYRKIPDADIPEEYAGSRGVEIRLSSPLSAGSLCCRSSLYIILYYSASGCKGFINHTGSAPFYDISVGGGVVGRFGAGCGSSRVEPFDINWDYLINSTPNLLGLNEYVFPVIPGFQPHQYPPGKLTEARLAGIEWGDKREYYQDWMGQVHEDRCTFSYILQYWETPELIHFDLDDRTPGVKYNVHTNSYHSGGFQEWYPWGAISLLGSVDGISYIRLSGVQDFIQMDGVNNEFCWTNWLADGDFKHFATIINTSAFYGGGGYNNSYLGDPTCQSGSDDCGNSCPLPGQRGLFFLEKDKDFIMKNPSCRCPEDSSPAKIPLAPCPGDSSKLILGDDCISWIPASSAGLVYDYLI